MNAASPGCKWRTATKAGNACLQVLRCPKPVQICIRGIDTSIRGWCSVREVALVPVQLLTATGKHRLLTLNLLRNAAYNARVMTDRDERIEKLQISLLDIGKHLLRLDAAIAELQAAVNVLKICLILQSTPDRIEEWLDMFRVLEKKILASDPKETERQKASETIEALRLWIQRGQKPSDS
jgi:hypothetical protein